MRLTEQEIGETLGKGLAIEYTRDSPFAAAQYGIFEENAENLNLYCKNACQALANLDTVVKQLILAQAEVGKALSGSATKSTRTLFTNALPNLSPLDETMKLIAQELNQLCESQVRFCSGVQQNVRPYLEGLRQEAKQLVSKSRRSEVERNRKSFESLLAREFQQFDSLTEAKTKVILNARETFELSRYDLILSINRLEHIKKLELTKAALNLHNEISLLSRGEASSGCNLELGRDVNRVWELRSVQLQDSKDYFALSTQLWEGVRFRLKSELHNELPPPNAPLLASCPVQPRTHRYSNYRLLTFSPTTEVLSSGSRAARFQERRHASSRDGILKQGWLMPRPALRFGPPVRQWHRLHNSVLYAVPAGGGNMGGADLVQVCNVGNARVVLSKALLFGFKIELTDHRGQLRSFEYQAENEDEHVAWVHALRRCSHSRLVNENEAGEEKSIKTRLVTFLNDNNSCCADCSADKCNWVSINLMVVVCDECALVHDQLGWSVSKLKHAEKDKYFEWEVALLEAGGNERGNAKWEAAIPIGWAKPQPTASPEARRVWVSAKYQWFAFVSDSHLLDEEGLARLIISDDATVDNVHLHLTRKVDINKKLDGGLNVMQLAIQHGNTLVACFLLVNGSDFTDEDLAELTRLMGYQTDFEIV